MGDMTEINNRLLVMTAGGLNPNVMINALAARFPDIHVIVEQAESKSAILKRRARRLGWIDSRRPDGDDDRLPARQTLHCSAQPMRSLPNMASLPISARQFLLHNVASLNDEECHKAINHLASRRRSSPFPAAF